MTNNSRGSSGELLRMYLKRLTILSPVILLGIAAVGLGLLVFGIVLPEFLRPSVVMGAILLGMLVLILVLPVLLGIYPRVSALIGYRLTILITFVPLVVVVTGIVVFVLFGYQIDERAPQLNFTEILADDWHHVRTYRLDTNSDDDWEWVVLYRFDLLNEEEKRSSPITAVVYQLDDSRPANMVAHDLRPPDKDYLCECLCTPTMEDVLSGLAGDELVVYDRCDEAITRLTIFHWDPDRKEYVSPGHFLGGHVEVGQDKVTTKECLPDRAQLMTVKTYYPDDNKTYYRQDDPCSPLECRKKELDFCHGEPGDVLYSPYPEKVVLAFYKHYNDDEVSPTYFSERVRDHLGQCDAGECGCTAPRHEITHVRVTYLKPEDATATDPERAVVGVRVICERRDGSEEGERYVRWHLVREDDRWQLERSE